MFIQNPTPQNIYKLKMSPVLIGLTLSAPARDGKGEQLRPLDFFPYPNQDLLDSGGTGNEIKFSHLFCTMVQHCIFLAR